MHQKFKGIYWSNGKLWTQNSVPGTKVYSEKLQIVNEKEFRQWNPYKSKLAAAIQNGLKEMPVCPGTNILYLGCGEGTTVSHLSDIIGKKGIVLGLDSSARVMPKFVRLCEHRENIIPLLADARKPKTYAAHLKGIQIDVLYQDVAQAKQAQIFLQNSCFLKPTGKGLLVIKAPSIDSSISPKKVFERQTKELKPAFDIIQTVFLEPFQTAHAIVYCQKKP